MADTEDEQKAQLLTALLLCGETFDRRELWETKDQLSTAATDLFVDGFCGGDLARDRAYVTEAGKQFIRDYQSGVHSRAAVKHRTAG